MIYHHVLKTLLVGVTAAALITCAPQMENGPARHASKPDRDIMVIGHRGAAGLAPENTLAAFAASLDLGVDALELDVHLTRDGTLVVYHDYTLKPETTRTPDGEWLDIWTGLAIKDLSLAELKTYDVGRLDPYSFYADRYPDQAPVDGETIPTLREVIALMQVRGCPAELWIEIKTSPMEPQVSSQPEDVAEAVVNLLRSGRHCRCRENSFFRLAGTHPGSTDSTGYNHHLSHPYQLRHGYHSGGTTRSVTLDRRP